MSRKRFRWFRQIGVAFAMFVAIVGIGGLALKNYATPLQRDNIAVPLYTVGDANYAAALAEGKNIVKFGRLPFGIYQGGLAFKNPLDAREYLRRIGKEADWGVYQLSGDFELDTKLVNGERYTTESLLVIGGVGKEEDSKQSNKSDCQRGNVVLEAHASLKDAPAGAVEVMTGNYLSVMLGKPCPFRVFSPAVPKWSTDEDHFHSSDGLRLVVYVMNLKGVPRPSKATDRAIIEDLIKNNFLVVTADFAGGRVTDHLEWQKDVNGLFCVFGGKWHTEQGWFTRNRKDLLQYPGPNKGMSFTSFPHPGNSSVKTVPVNKAGIYVIPSGYTVEPHLVFKENFKNASQRQTLFMDVVYPMPSPGTTKVPLLLEISSTARGEYVVNANTTILYSWLFNGYAFASMSYARPDGKKPIHPLVHGLRYLQSQKDRFSLTGKVGTAGISKSSGRCHVDSNLKENQKTDVDSEPYGAETSRVEVCMPAVGAIGEPGDWKTLNKSSPAAVLSWCQLNGGHRVGSKNAGIYRKARNAYEAAGIGDKCLYLVSPLAGHEYDVYHLNEIMAFFDKHCK